MLVAWPPPGEFPNITREISYYMWRVCRLVGVDRIGPIGVYNYVPCVTGDGMRT